MATTPKHPNLQQVIPLVDPYKVQEVFANELTGIQIRDGLLHITYSTIRAKHTARTEAVNTHDTDLERVVTIRNVIPLPLAQATVEALRQLTTAIQQDQAARKQPN